MNCSLIIRGNVFNTIFVNLPKLLLILLISFSVKAGAKELTASRIKTQDQNDSASWIDFNKDGAKNPYEDSSLEIDTRVEDLLSRMNNEEKTCQLATLYGYGRVLSDDLPREKWKKKIWKDGIGNIDEHINGIAGWKGNKESEYVWPPSKHAKAIDKVQRWFIEETRLGIPVDFTNEGIRGLCHRDATNFPAQVGVGATWNRDLVRKIGEVTGKEAKALGYTHIYSPILDVARDPRWGRAVECYGEDPFHVASLGIEQVRGLRSEGVGATLKHFAAYSVPEGGRDGEARTNPQANRSDLESILLYPFREVIQHADVTGVMSSYNDYDGIPVSGSSQMLCDVLRNQWGFKGYVVSDSDAVKFLYEKHHVATSIRDAVKMFLEGGGNVRTEFNAPDKFILPTRELIEEGLISQSVIDDRVRDVIRVKFELGLFDQPYISDQYDADEIVHCDEHRQLALQAAQESIVLLKNDANALPLSKSLSKILVCGPNATSIEHSRSRYGPVMGEVVTVLEGIRSAVSENTEVLYAEGAKVIDKNWPESELFQEDPDQEEQAMIDHAVEMARGVDTIIVVLGGGVKTVGECKSRTDLDLPGHQGDLVRALQSTGKPVIAVLINGRAMTVNWMDRHVPAILEAWFPGEYCGTAIAQVLFGDCNPGGKLPVTFPKTVGQLPLNFPYKRGSHGGQVGGNDPTGNTDSRVMGTLYPLGHGLSYTTFEYSNLTISSKEIQVGDKITVSCEVTNQGEVAGDEVVQLYLRDLFASTVPFDSVLRGFERISLEPGESRKVLFQIKAKDMEILAADRKWRVEPGEFEVLIGSSSEDIRLTDSYQVIE